MSGATSDIVAQTRVDGLDRTHKTSTFYRRQDPRRKTAAHLAALAALRAQIDGDPEHADAARARFIAAAGGERL